MKYRTRSISFRLSDRELARVRAACAQENSPSLSDYARSVLLQHTSGKRPVHGLLEDKLQAFASELHQMQAVLGEFLAQLENQGTAEAAEEPDNAQSATQEHGPDAMVHRA